MPENILEHQRAAFAARRVLEDRFPQTPRPRDKVKDYRGVAIGAGTLLRQCGLIQLAAFWLTKKDRRRPDGGLLALAEEKQVLQDILLWLRASPVTETLCRQHRSDGHQIPALPSEPSSAVVQALTNRPSQEIAMLETEAGAFLGWLKRVAEGLYKDLGGGDGESEEEDG